LVWSESVLVMIISAVDIVVHHRTHQWPGKALSKPGKGDVVKRSALVGSPLDDVKSSPCAHI
jgi:hypothetical protein